MGIIFINWDINWTIASMLAGRQGCTKNYELCLI